MKIILNKIYFLIKKLKYIKKYFIKKTKNLFSNHFNFRKNYFYKKIKIDYKNYLEIGIGDGLRNEKKIKKSKNLKIFTEFYKKPLKKFFIKNKIFFLKKKFLIKKKNLFKNLKKKKYKIINFNPPYISYKNINKKSKKLKFENINALTDFKNGYFFYKKILKKNNFFKKKKYILIEINKKQEKNLLNIIKKNNILCLK